MSSNNYHRKSSIHSIQFDPPSTSTWSRPNCYRLLFVIIFTLLSIGSTTSLIIVLYKDIIKEKALAEKRKGWAKKWKIVEPYVKKFPLGIVLDFIRNLIVLAIERQFQF